MIEKLDFYDLMFSVCHRGDSLFDRHLSHFSPALYTRPSPTESDRVIFSSAVKRVLPNLSHVVSNFGVFSFVEDM